MKKVYTSGMNLRIDTSTHDTISVSLQEKGSVARLQVSAPHQQAEKLLPLIEKVLIKQDKTFKDIQKIIVTDEGVGFTALRIGIATANALAYAHGIPVVSEAGKALKKKGIQIVIPQYASAPHITIKKVIQA